MEKKKKQKKKKTTTQYKAEYWKVFIVCLSVFYLKEEKKIFFKA